jgi:hypothetical protein
LPEGESEDELGFAADSLGRRNLANSLKSSGQIDLLSPARPLVVRFPEGGQRSDIDLLG